MSWRWFYDNSDNDFSEHIQVNEDNDIDNPTLRLSGYNIYRDNILIGQVRS